MKTNTIKNILVNKFFTNITASALLATILFTSLIPAVAGSRRAETFESRVAAFGVREYKVTFYGGEIARVIISGDSDTKLGIRILDSNRDPVRTQLGLVEDVGLDCEVEWIPRETRTYTIQVVNLGAVYNDFELYHN